MLSGAGPLPPAMVGRRRARDLLGAAWEPPGFLAGGDGALPEPGAFRWLARAQASITWVNWGTGVLRPGALTHFIYPWKRWLFRLGENPAVILGLVSERLDQLVHQGGCGGAGSICHRVHPFLARTNSSVCWGYR